MMHWNKKVTSSSVCKSTKLIFELFVMNTRFTLGGGDQQHNKKEEEVVQLHAEAGAFSLMDPVTVTGGLSGGGLYDKPLPCCSCGIGWFSFLMGFVFPPLWLFATVLYFGNYYQKDPRERPGLAASAIAALICSVAATIFMLTMLLSW